MIGDVRWVDQRGWSSRLALSFEPKEVYVSVNPIVGTLRGLHYEVGDGAREKVAYCMRGRLWDVGVNVATGTRHSAILAAGDGMRWADGIAHGYITLEPDTELIYLMSKKYKPEHARGLRWDDPALNIDWPIKPTLMSERDRSFPDWSPA